MAAQDYVIKDLSLAAWGRKEIAMAEDEMPGLREGHAEYAASRPFHGTPLPRCSSLAHQTPD